MVWWSQVSCGRRGRSGRSSRDCRHGCITVWGTLNPEPCNPWPFKIAEDDDEPPGPAGRMLALPGARQSGLQQSTGPAVQVLGFGGLGFFRTCLHVINHTWA